MDEAYRVAERIRTEIRAKSALRSGIPPMTVSIGIAKIGAENLETALVRADTFLYQAKNEGRDRTCR